MKFFVSSGFPKIGSKSRLGKINELKRLPDLDLETPLVLLHTKGGSVAHLTRDVLQKVIKEECLLQIPLSNSARCYNGVKGYPGNISEFVGLKEYVSYCTVHDPTVALVHGHNNKTNISMWTVNGRVEVNPERFMNMIEAFQPDIYEVLSDSDNDANSSMKRLKKLALSTPDLLAKCLLRHQNSKVLQNSAVLGVVEGGYDLKIREQCANDVSKHSQLLDGFVISGLHTNGPEVESLPLRTVTPIVNHTLKLLPHDKLRVIHGCWRPDVVVGLVELGVDVFDSTLIDVVTDRFGAFVFHWEAVQRFSVNANENVEPQVVDTNVPNCLRSSNNYKMEICLKDKEYFEDFSPILEGCTCLTCTNHTKAYVHHLVNTNELLGPLLLTIHNLHHYMEFFSFIRDSIRKGLTVNVI